MFGRLTVAALLLLAVAPCLPAQDTASTPHRPGSAMAGNAGAGGISIGAGLVGTITAIEGQTITVKSVHGTMETVKTSDSTAFHSGRQAAKLSEFKPGDSILVAGEEKD